jgi:protein SCO1
MPMGTRSTARGPTLRVAILAVILAGVVTGTAEPAVGPPPGEPAPNFALTTQQNDRLWLTQLRGRVVVLAFGCTRCDACPGLVPALAEVARGLGDAAGLRVFFALVTVDPGRDTPAELRGFARANGFRAPAWILLTEDRAGQVDVVARRYGVAVRRAGSHVEADCAVTLIDGSGRIRARYPPSSLDALGRDVGALLGTAASP